MVFRSGIGKRAAPKLSSTGSSVSLARAFPGLFAFFLLLGLVVQGTAIQTHVHFARQAGPQPVASSDGYAPAAKPNKDDSPANCPLCQEAAMAGAYVLPPATVLPPPPAAVLWIADSAMTAFRLLTPDHGWHSRAPPQ
jgi:hypothetical protein